MGIIDAIYEVTNFVLSHPEQANENGGQIIDSLRILREEIDTGKYGEQKKWNEL